MQSTEINKGGDNLTYITSLFVWYIVNTKVLHLCVKNCQMLSRMLYFAHLNKNLNYTLRV